MGYSTALTRKGPLTSGSEAVTGRAGSLSSVFVQLSGHNVQDSSCRSHAWEHRAGTRKEIRHSPWVNQEFRGRCRENIWVSFPSHPSAKQKQHSTLTCHTYVGLESSDPSENKKAQHSAVSMATAF